MKPKRLLAVLTLPTLLSVATPLVAHAATATTVSQISLSQGATGSQVTLLQNDLNALGFPVGQADGQFGPVTTSAVKSFQTKEHLQVDGAVGPLTWNAINAAVAPLASKPIQLPANSKAVTNVETKNIYYNGKLMTSPSGFTYQGTDYMPIWYIMTLMDQIGFSHTWSNNVWNINVPASSGINIDYSNIKYGKGSTSIAINGTVVARVDCVVHVDPASGIATTFMPTWYVMNALGRLGITSTWQGTTWGLKQTPPTSSQPGSGSGSTTTGSGTGGTATGSGSGGSTTGTGSGSGSTGTGGSTTTPSASFTNVDLRFPAPADVNAQSVDQFLTAHGSPMAGLGSSFLEAQNTYGVDANYLVAHAILESNWGKSSIALAKNNLYGYGAYDSNPGSDAGMFGSNDYAIRFQAWEVRNNYLEPGASEFVSPTLTGMNVNYATDKSWANSIGGLMGEVATSVQSSVNDYQQYPSTQAVPAPSSRVEPVFYLNGAQATVQNDQYYAGGAVPYFSTMGTGMSQQFFGPLQLNSAGEAVSELQTFLNQQESAGLTVDGQFGAKTQTAVENFQKNVMNTTPTGVWTYAMWTQYFGAVSASQTIPAGANVTIDQAEEGMAAGLVVPWYHVVGYGWVDSQYIKLANVYRLTVSNPTSTATSIPVYNPSNPSQQIATLHNGDFVVAEASAPAGGVYTIQFAAQTSASSGGKAPGTPITGLVQANGNVTLVPQS